MRYTTTQLKRRVKSDLAIRNECEGLTSYAGLELIRRYFSTLALGDQIRRQVGRWLPSSDYGSVAMLLLVLILIISGGRRVRHIEYMDSDPMV